MAMGADYSFELVFEFSLLRLWSICKLKQKTGKNYNTIKDPHKRVLKREGVFKIKDIKNGIHKKYKCLPCPFIHIPLQFYPDTVPNNATASVFELIYT